MLFSNPPPNKALQLTARQLFFSFDADRAPQLKAVVRQLL